MLCAANVWSVSIVVGCRFKQNSLVTILSFSKYETIK